ncbi:hypothetical protein [Halobellus ruber]|uniref:Uncharacterized protein n=1 Tax=Halobellus ruber TaxID=2761102 RepID=A0A7J9SKF2_9EURY|nr:hypothetical protein [Halobellus ruber]MBB6647434.1 hypothetical protein [Halobellus ruber]
MANALTSLARIVVRWLHWIPSVDRLLGVVSGTILAWNTVPGLIATTTPGGAASRLVGVQPGVLASLVSLGLNVLLLGLVVVAFLPRVYVGPLREPIRSHSVVRRTLVTYAFAVGTVYYLWGSSVGTSSLPAGVPAPPQWLLTVALFLGIPLAGVALYRIGSRPVSDPESRFVRPLVGLSTDDDAAEAWRSEFGALAARPRIRRIASVMVVIAGTSVFVMPAALLGVFVGTLSLYYPIIEVVALVGTVGSWALRSDRTPTPDSVVGDGFAAATDVDSSFYRQLRTAVTPRAWGVFLPVLLGVLFAVVPLLLSGAYNTPAGAFRSAGLRDAYRSVAELRTLGSVAYALDVTGDAAVWVALSVTPLLVVCYCLWYWFRVVRRLPTLLYHADDAPVRARLGDAAATPTVSRPRGAFLPLAAVVWVWLSHRFTRGESFVPVPPAEGEFGFLLLWSMGVGALGWTVYDAMRSEPSVPDGPVRELYVPLGVQIVVVTDMGLDTIVEAGSLLALLILFVGLYYLPAKVETLFEFPRSRRLLVCGVVGAAFSLLTSVRYDVSASLLAGAAIFATFALGGEWHEIVEEGN